MKRVFEEPNEGMEAPCMCDCEKWFDLDEGYSNPRGNNVVVCKECYDRIEQEISNEEEIDDLLSTLADAEYTVKDCKEQLAKLNYKPSEQPATAPVEAQQPIPDSGEIEKAVTLPLNFWYRLKGFVGNVQVADMMSEEEKEMIIHVCEQSLSSPTLK